MLCVYTDVYKNSHCLRDIVLVFFNVILFVRQRVIMDVQPNASERSWFQELDSNCNGTEDCNEICIILSESYSDSVLVIENYWDHDF